MHINIQIIKKNLSNTEYEDGSQMKWLIASDLHGSSYYCALLLKALERESADRLLFLGDILYHGPRNELPQGYAPKEVITMLNGIKDSMLCVKGNCDSDVDQMVLEFPIMAEYSLIPIGKNNLIFATPGDKYNMNNMPAHVQSHTLDKPSR